MRVCYMLMVDDIKFGMVIGSRFVTSGRNGTPFVTENLSAARAMATRKWCYAPKIMKVTNFEELND